MYCIYYYEYIINLSFNKLITKFTVQNNKGLLWAIVVSGCR